MAAAAALIAVAPAAAQSQATIAPAAETSLGSDGANAQFDGGTSTYLIAAVLLGLVIWGVIELTDDDETVSPD